MPISDEKRKGQEDYAVAMAIMKEMKAKGIINKEAFCSPKRSSRSGSNRTGAIKSLNSIRKKPVKSRVFGTMRPAPKDAPHFDRWGAFV
ncbi:MAG: hypothetical protein IJT69_02795 [Clostridia bacterium]|nr:hypothetical protein [Clostridia bacterium]